MPEKRFCPFMAIGFPAPEEGQRDMRICMKECAWYDVAEEKCAIKLIAERLEYIQSQVDDTNQMLSEAQYSSIIDETELDEYEWEAYNRLT